MAYDYETPARLQLTGQPTLASPDVTQQASKLEGDGGRRMRNPKFPTRQYALLEPLADEPPGATLIIPYSTFTYRQKVFII